MAQSPFPKEKMTPSAKEALLARVKKKRAKRDKF